MTLYRNRRACLAAGLFLAAFSAVLVPQTTFAATDAVPGPQRFDDDRGRLPLRIPPKIAMAACEGRREGDPCAFRSPRGILAGLCLPGREHLLLCRPQQNAAVAESAPPRAPEQRPEPAAVTQPEAAVSPKQDTIPARQPTPSAPPQQPVNANSPQPPAAQPAQPPPVPQTTAATAAPLSGTPEQSCGSVLPFMAVAMVAAGLTWYCSFRYYTVPLRRLRSVTRQLARGDLTARVGEGLVLRRNEVAELGRDVDRMAERIEGLMGAQQRLVRDVSHELRSPLARLNVALELARQSAGPSLSAPFDRINRESDRLNELISQLLMLTRLENESGMLRRAELDIAALIAEVAQDADFEASSKERRVTASASGPLLLNGDRELLRQALENLVRNAVRYTALNTTVEITLRKRESGGSRWAHIEVRDQGPGVPESELYDIFRPFYRVNDARERQSGGSGVGLAISERAVRLHRGSLRAFNAPGGGLIMEMELPLA